VVARLENSVVCGCSWSGGHLSTARQWSAVGHPTPHLFVLAESVAMTVHLIRGTRLFPGVPYAYAATVPGLVFTAGACPLDEQGAVVAPGDVAAQARRSLANLRTTLDECGLTVRDVVKTTVYVASADRADLVAAWDEVAAAFGEHDVPSTLLGVTVLGYPDQLVEIEAVAALPSDG
jgi:enamine deaminase RidA (YjgF/YER057c/UK114 family)